MNSGMRLSLGCVLMAAGSGSRFGGNKLDAVLDGRTLLERALEGGRKSFRMDELDMNWVLPQGRGVLVPYLEMINRDLAERDSDSDD